MHGLPVSGRIWKQQPIQARPEKSWKNLEVTGSGVTFGQDLYSAIFESVRLNGVSASILVLEESGSQTKRRALR